MTHQQQLFPGFPKFSEEIQSQGILETLRKMCSLESTVVDNYEIEIVQEPGVVAATSFPSQDAILERTISQAFENGSLIPPLSPSKYHPASPATPSTAATTHDQEMPTHEEKGVWAHHPTTYFGVSQSRPSFVPPLDATPEGQQFFQDKRASFLVGPTTTKDTTASLKPLKHTEQTIPRYIDIDHDITLRALLHGIDTYLASEQVEMLYRTSGHSSPKTYGSVEWNPTPFTTSLEAKTATSLDQELAQDLSAAPGNSCFSSRQNNHFRDKDTPLTPEQANRVIHALSTKGGFHALGQNSLANNKREWLSMAISDASNQYPLQTRASIVERFTQKHEYPEPSMFACSRPKPSYTTQRPPKYEEGGLMDVRPSHVESLLARTQSSSHRGSFASIQT